MHRNVDDWADGEKHVLAYPRERVEEFSPYSKAILEIRSDKDLQVLQKIYANGVLLGDKSERGWGITYAREFDMTNDSRLFPSRRRVGGRKGIGTMSTAIGFLVRGKITAGRGTSSTESPA